MVTVIQSLLKSWLTTDSIDNRASLMEFIYQQTSRMAGELVIKYAQKRLGKLHYNYSRDSQEYNRELMHCQAQLHGLLISDIECLLSRLINSSTDTLKNQQTLRQQLQRLHQRYLETSPVELSANQPIEWSNQAMSLARLAEQTGLQLFELLPLTESMRQADVEIFQGQLRYSYANFLQALDRRIKPDQLREMFD